MEKRYVSHLERMANECQRTLNDGICRILRIKTDVFSPAIAEVSTDLGEQFAVFDRSVLTALSCAKLQNRGVRTRIRRANGHRWIWSVHVLPLASDADWPCVNCGTVTLPEQNGSVFICQNCHARMTP